MNYRKIEIKYSEMNGDKIAEVEREVEVDSVLPKIISELIPIIEKKIREKVLEASWSWLK